METRKIEHLLEKFYDGTSSLEEEQQLRQYFSSDNLPEHLKSLKPQFCHPDFFITHHKTREKLKADLECTIRSAEKKSTKDKRNRLIFSMAAAAAVLLLMIGILSTPEPKKIEDTFNNPEQAYEEARRALLYVSEHLSKGLIPLQEGASKLNQGMDKTGEISRLEIIKSFIKSDSELKPQIP